MPTKISIAPIPQMYPEARSAEQKRLLHYAYLERVNNNRPGRWVPRHSALAVLEYSMLRKDSPELPIVLVRELKAMFGAGLENPKNKIDLELCKHALNLLNGEVGVETGSSSLVAFVTRAMREGGVDFEEALFAHATHSLVADRLQRTMIDSPPEVNRPIEGLFHQYLDLWPSVPRSLKAGGVHTAFSPLITRDLEKIRRAIRLEDLRIPKSTPWA